MTAYAAPVQDMLFTLNAVADLEQVAALPGGEAAAADIVPQILESAAQLAADVIAPLNQSGDRIGSALENGVVRTPPGFREAYAAYVAGGWNAMPFDPDVGGQGLPWTVVSATQEMWQSANMAFGLCPTLNFGAVELLQVHASPDQRQRYLRRLVEGSWTATMNLTEAHAGSDVGAIRTRAVPDGNGRYRIYGQKIFITYGEHDLADNIVHLVLARLPDAPEGTRGISLFIVPKFEVGPDGAPGRRNDVHCVSLEHKLGIHASPTAVMAFGDADGAVGELVGAPHGGMAAMFTMMNNARLTVGLQGVAIGERAYQQARDYARIRIQGRDPAGRPTAIIRHADVRRMLLTMRALTQGARCLAYAAAAALDFTQRHPDPEARRRSRDRLDLLTPVVKAWCTEAGLEAASLGIQVHGGSGFIEETGAAQHYRDARITTIYEGTNGIQANDLAFRKVARDGGAAAAAFRLEVASDIRAAETLPGLAGAARRLAGGLDALERATAWVIASAAPSPESVAAGAMAYLRLFGLVGACALLLRSAVAASKQHDSKPEFAADKIATARFFADHLLVPAEALAVTVINGAPSLLDFPPERF